MSLAGVLYEGSGSPSNPPKIWKATVRQCDRAGRFLCDTSFLCDTHRKTFGNFQIISSIETIAWEVRHWFTVVYQFFGVCLVISWQTSWSLEKRHHHLFLILFHWRSFHYHHRRLGLGRNQCQSWSQWWIARPSWPVKSMAIACFSYATCGQRQGCEQLPGFAPWFPLIQVGFSINGGYPK